MDWKKYSWILSLLITLLFAACSNSNTITPTNIATNPVISATEIASIAETPVPPPTKTTLSTMASASLCAHSYFPVREGATWAYQSTGSPADEYPFTESITSVRHDGFALTADYEKFSRTQQWSCSPEGLLALQLGGPVVAALQSQSIQLDLESKDMSGITFPHKISTGDAWQQVMELEGPMTMAGQDGIANANAQSNFRALGWEKVSVPAGEFETMKIQVETLVILNVTYEGLTVPVTYKATYSYWFAPEIGWVKANGSAEIAGQSFAENIELVSHNIP